MKRFSYRYPATCWFFILLCCMTLLLLNGCNKKDRDEKQATEITPAPVSIFFNVSLLTDPLVTVIANSLYRQDQDGNIESRLSHHAGLSNWNKATVNVSTISAPGKSETRIIDWVKELNALTIFQLFTRFDNAISGHSSTIAVDSTTPSPLHVVLPPSTPGGDLFLVANNLAKNMDSIYMKSNAESLLNAIPNLATLPVEKGFAIVKKIRINPQNVRDTTLVGYRTDEVCTGTDTSINITVNTNRLEVLGATLHSHPPMDYSAPSAKDVYNLIDNRLNHYHFEGSFVAASDGSKYALTITNAEQASAFFATKNKYLGAGTKWNEDSEIGKFFKSATTFFRNKYKGNTNVKNLAYEMAMAAVLGRFNSGITLYKQDVAGNFKPILIKEMPGPGKPKKIIYIQEYP